MSKKVKVVIAGAAGRMGTESIKAILSDEEIELVGAVGRRGSSLIGKDLGYIANIQETGLMLEDNLKNCLQSSQPDVMLDFTVPGTVYQNALLALECGVRPILGATGISDEDIAELEKKVQYYDSAALIAPNFAIGVLLMIEAAKKAAKYIHNVEIIETHHEKKVDAPSGTAIKTAKEISLVFDQLAHQGKTPKRISELADNQTPRGEIHDQVRVHSLRLPGAIAHQEIVFGDVGQMLTLRHDAIHRSAYMPGVTLAIREIINRKGLVYGLEHYLD